MPEPPSGPERTPDAAALDRLERSANRMALVSRWADDLAHEIKNPLHAMVINLELVKRRAGSAEPAPIVERAEIVEAELHRVHALIDSLLRVVRPWPEQESADAERVFEMLLPLVRARTRIRKLTYDHHPGRGRAAIAPGDLALALLNLLDTAIEATPGGGRVATRCETEEEVVRITITDSGAGLSSPEADHEVHAGVPDRAGQEGVGLAVTGRLIREAGGELRVEPAASGGGTVATIILPSAGSA